MVSTACSELLVGTNSGQLLALGGSIGNQDGAFTAQESFTFTLGQFKGSTIQTQLGPVASSPTADPYNDQFIFGADGVVREALEPVWDEGRVSRAR